MLPGHSLTENSTFDGKSMNQVLFKDKVRSLIPWPLLNLYYTLRISDPKLRGVKRKFGNNPVRFSQSGSDVVSGYLRGKKPCLITRFGWVELQTILEHLAGNGYSDSTRKLMRFNAGFFPAEDAMFDRFSEESLKLLEMTDVLAVTGRRGDEELVMRHHPDISLIAWTCIGDDALFYEPSWISALKGQRVLVIHPFAETFEKQWPKRNLLFPKGVTPPDFELLTFKAVQSAGGAEKNLPYKTWFDALNAMCDSIDRLDFDTALIGAGAYGMFLGGHIKKTGRKALHMGGSLQLLFGVRGARWETVNPEVGRRLFNGQWVRPPAADVPPQSNQVENSCYW